MKEIEVTAKNVDEAVTEVKKEWDLLDEEIEVEIIDPGSKGFLKIGSREAVVKIRILPEYFSKKAGNYIRRILNFSKDGLEDLEITTETKDSKIFIYLNGSNLGRMIGKHGKTISALQHISNIYVNRITDSKVNVFIEVGDYKDRRKDLIKKIAKQSAYKVKKTGKRIQLDPMFAFERRIIHETLKPITGIKSFSMGLEPYRFVVIEPLKRRIKTDRFEKRGGKLRENENQSQKVI